jgi:glutaconate CoA-transferase subunit B
MRLKKRAFVEKLDFLTSPGHLEGGNSRQNLGIPGAGPVMVITDRALFVFDDASGEMTLTELAPGESIESIQAEISWPIKISAEVKEMVPPKADELDLIREKLDPEGMYR